MKKKLSSIRSILVLSLIGLFLAACSSAPANLATQPVPTIQVEQTTPAGPVEPTAPVEQETQPALPTQETQGSEGSAAEALTRTDAQGAVEVAVTPLNLDNPGETVDFDIAMNTHSVDLSMDLSTLATLRTDAGQTVQAAAWDAPGGGHHVEGKLSFPAEADGRPLLEGARQLTLTIQGVDVPERVFTWDLE